MQILPPTAGRLGATITGLHPATLTPEDARRIVSLVHEHALVVFTNQSLTTREYVEFARRLGPLDVYLQESYHHPEFPEIFVSSNEVVDGKPVGVARTGNYWHTDGAFLATPYTLTMLYPQKLPTSKRETFFVDMGRVYERLPPDLRAAVEGTTAKQDCKWRYKITAREAGYAIIEILEAIEKACPAVTHPTIIIHPTTGRKLLYVSPGFTTAIDGKCHEESQTLLKALFDFATREENVYTHRYELGDVLLWDNRQLIHKSGDTPTGEVSTIFRLNPNDQQPFYVGHQR